MVSVGIILEPRSDSLSPQPLSLQCQILECRFVKEEDEWPHWPFGDKGPFPFQTLVGFPSAASLCSPVTPAWDTGSRPSSCLPPPTARFSFKPVSSIFPLAPNAQHLPGGGADVCSTTSVERDSLDE